VTNAEASRFGEFATELLDGCSFEQLSAHARILDYNLDQTHQAIAIQSPPTGGNRIEVVERVARNLGVRTPLVTSRSDRTILILPEELSWESLAAALSVAFGTSTPIGVGGKYQLEEVRRSLAEAIFALELGTVFQSDIPVTTFGDLGVWRILVDSNEPSKLREFVYEWIGALIDYDKLHGSELIKSLTQYLKESCATEATAKSLYIHRNTLRYRLSKVAQITGRDLGDADQRFQLELACRAWVVLQTLEAK
jgi:DNA-binding PucR family transcriptional regulator